MIDEHVRRFLASERFAVLATVAADGWPHQAVIWYRLEPEGLVVNSREGRIWPANLRREPRASLLVEDGYDRVSLRVRAELRAEGDLALEDIAEMARRYHSDDPAYAEELIERTFRPQRRISFLLRPDAVSTHISR